MSLPTEDLPWVYDPETKHVYRGFPFDGLEQLEVDEDGQPKLPPAAKAAITKAEKAEEAKK
jgi:hypothetical protein